MCRSFVDYLKDNTLFQDFGIEQNLDIAAHCDAQMIENLSGYKIDTQLDFNPRTKDKIIGVLESQLRAQREKASNSSHQYNSNRHIGLIQALNKLRSKKTQP